MTLNYIDFKYNFVFCKFLFTMGIPVIYLIVSKLKYSVSAMILKYIKYNQCIMNYTNFLQLVFEIVRCFNAFMKTCIQYNTRPRALFRYKLFYCSCNLVVAIRNYFTVRIFLNGNYQCCQLHDIRQIFKYLIFNIHIFNIQY